MAQEELRWARGGIRTRGLKGAVTTIAANIVESVGSLLGSSKVRTLERENKNLHERISELEEEARQREQQQTKRIQETTDAYEQRHHRSSEFVNFVKHYFPYVEKLMPTIKFLHDTLNFGDGLIRKLCTLKDVSIKGDLYSPEFRQHFEVDGAACSPKQNTGGNFGLKVDGASYTSWSRHRKDEFMEVLGLPTRKQNRGIQLQIK